LKFEPRQVQVQVATVTVRVRRRVTVVVLQARPGPPGPGAPGRSVGPALGLCPGPQWPGPPQCPSEAHRHWPRPPPGRLVLPLPPPPQLRLCRAWPSGRRRHAAARAAALRPCGCCCCCFAAMRAAARGALTLVPGTRLGKRGGMQHTDRNRTTRAHARAARAHARTCSAIEAHAWGLRCPAVRDRGLGRARALHGLHGTMGMAPREGLPARVTCPAG
jgi:hypothetical protein